MERVEAGGGGMVDGVAGGGWRLGMKGQTVKTVLFKRVRLGWAWERMGLGEFIIFGL